MGSQGLATAAGGGRGWGGRKGRPGSGAARAGLSGPTIWISTVRTPRVLREGWRGAHRVRWGDPEVLQEMKDR